MTMRWLLLVALAGCRATSEVVDEGGCAYAAARPGSVRSGWVQRGPLEIYFEIAVGVWNSQVRQVATKAQMFAVS